MIGSFARMTGVDLGFVPVVRTPAVATTAAGLNARAFTTGAVVHVPDAAGPLDRSDTEALVAHELAHVLQQRALGGRARESGLLGERLESVAQEVEAAYRGRRGADTVGDLLAGTGAVPPGVTDDEPPVPDRPGHDLEAGGPLSWTPQHGFRAEPAPPPVQRAVVSELAGAPAAGPPTGPAAADSPDGEAVPLAYPVLDQAERPEPGRSSGGEAPEDVEARRTGLADLDEETLAGLAARIGARLTVSPVDTRDPELLDQLAVRLYGRLRSRLRRELLSDRERVGLLTEFH